MTRFSTPHTTGDKVRSTSRSTPPPKAGCRSAIHFSTFQENYLGGKTSGHGVFGLEFISTVHRVFSTENSIFRVFLILSTSTLHVVGVRSRKVPLIFSESQVDSGSRRGTEKFSELLLVHEDLEPFHRKGNSVYRNESVRLL